MDNPLQSLEAAVEKQPWYVWAGALTGAGVVGWFVLRKRATTTAAPAPAATSTGTDTSAINGYDVASMAGIPYGYSNTSGPVDNFPSNFPGVQSGNSTVPYLPAGVNPIYDPQGNLVGYQQAPTSTSTSTKESGVVRQMLPNIDKGNKQGVPIRPAPTPDSAIVGYVPYGGQVQITGAPITGLDNLGVGQHAPGVGSTLWFPVSFGGKTGYMSTFDIVSMVAAGTGIGTGNKSAPGGQWQGAVNQHRMTIDQLHQALGMA